MQHNAAIRHKLFTIIKSLSPIQNDVFLYELSIGQLVYVSHAEIRSCLSTQRQVIFRHFFAEKLYLFN